MGGRLDPLRVVWGNASAIELWGARDLDDLRQRDFSNASHATMMQIHGWLDAFREGTHTHFVRDWTLYPKGVPLNVRSFISPFEFDDGSHGYLQQSWPNPHPIDPIILRGAEAIRHTSVGVATLSVDGHVLSRNLAMERAFGVDTSPNTWFEQPELLDILLNVTRTATVLRTMATSPSKDPRNPGPD